MVRSVLIDLVSTSSPPGFGVDTVYSTKPQEEGMQVLEGREALYYNDEHVVAHDICTCGMVRLRDRQDKTTNNRYDSIWLPSWE